MVNAKVKIHNENVLAALQPGDLVSFKRKIYSHWGVYIGKGYVIHLRGNHDCKISEQISGKVLASMMGKIFSKASIYKEKFMDVAGKDKAKIKNYLDSEVPRCSWQHLPLKPILDDSYHILHRTTSPVFDLRKAEKENGEILYDQKLILEECETYYKELYRNRDSKLTELEPNYLGNNVPHAK